MFKSIWKYVTYADVFDVTKTSIPSVRFFGEFLLMLGIVPVPRKETVVKKWNEDWTTLADRETLKLVASVLLKMHQNTNNLQKGLMGCCSEMDCSSEIVSEPWFKLKSLVSSIS